MNSRLINILVDGSHLTKDRGTAGVQHEGNSTVLRIKFDESWDNLAKSVTWWNAKGLNPVVRVLTVDMLEDIQTDTRIYRCPIPAEPLTEAGMCTFVIDGFLDGKRQRSVSDQLKVTAAPYAANAGAAADPTPTQAEQLQAQMEAVIASIRRAIEAAGAADTAFAAAQAAQLIAAAATAAAEEATRAANDAKNAVVSKHAERHAATGDDAITPAIIGAATAEAVQAAQSAANAAATAAANANNNADGRVSKNGDTINGKLKVSWLEVTDYAQPLEAPEHIDFHSAGSTLDYNGRLSILLDGDLNYIRADGTGGRVLYERLITKSTHDIGEGAAMAPGSWYAVYE